MKKANKSRWLLWTMAFYFFCVISMFSAQNAERSTAESESFVEEGFRILESTGLSGKDNPEQKNDNSLKVKKKVFKKVHIFTRNAAHFGNFMILGFLYIMLVSSFKHRKDTNILIITLFCCLMAAAIDELHQRFVPGRGAQLVDVLIDFNGSCFGCMLFISSKLQAKIKRLFS